MRRKLSKGRSVPFKFYAITYSLTSERQEFAVNTKFTDGGRRNLGNFSIRCERSRAARPPPAECREPSRARRRAARACAGARRKSGALHHRPLLVVGRARRALLMGPPHASRLLAAAAAAALLSLSSGSSGECGKDGLYADYDTECREYYRCAGGAIAGRFVCGPGRVFAEADGACVPRRHRPCVRRQCAPADTTAYATPGTACRRYYRCDNGTALEHACSAGTWFDWERQACTRGAGACYEPLCAGLRDGDYPDPTHDCRRLLRCRGAELRAVLSCTGGRCSAECPPPRAAAIALPAGDADFCSDEACTSLCQHAEDGAYADRSTGCREYFVCEARRVIRRGVCEPGMLFAGRGCELAERATCPAPARSPCFNRADGSYRDYRNCSAWFVCRRERVVSRGACDPGLVWNGVGCVERTAFECEPPTPSLECEGRPSGTYQDLASNCTRYFHCDGMLRTGFTCASGEVWDGGRCAPAAAYLCPSLEPDSCYGKPDGRYRAHGAGCRGYYACAAGEKALYACPAGRFFDGDACAPTRPDSCSFEDYTCRSLADGYHAELESNCHRYFYCSGGDRLATLTCRGGKIFDGRACVDAALHICGALPAALTEHGARPCERDGFYVVEGTECRSYYFCLAGVRTGLMCELDQVFNGQVCVSESQYTCPG